MSFILGIENPPFSLAFIDRGWLDVGPHSPCETMSSKRPKPRGCRWAGGAVYYGDGKERGDATPLGCSFRRLTVKPTLHWANSLIVIFEDSINLVYYQGGFVRED
jgi:hypothetical protein